MLSLLQRVYYWMPPPIFVLVMVVQFVFFMSVLFRYLDLILELANKVIAVFGGIVAKVASWFL